MKLFYLLLLLNAFLFACKTKKANISSSTANSVNSSSEIKTGTSTNKIKDCPDELIINTMPIVGKSKRLSQYYIYKGERKELKDFDSTWVSKNCKVKVTTVQ